MSRRHRSRVRTRGAGTDHFAPLGLGRFESTLLQTFHPYGTGCARYEFIRIYRNKGVRGYFEFLDTLPYVVSVSGSAFRRFREVAAQLDRDSTSRTECAIIQSRTP
jgi:hypothetical protein